MQVAYSRAAKADLKEIWLYTKARWGETQADIYLRNIDKAIEVVVNNPKIGKSYEFKAGYFKYHFERHAIFYRLTVHKLEIIRILHQQMQPERQLN